MRHRQHFVRAGLVFAFASPGIVGCKADDQYNPPFYTWSSDGACGVPLGYIGLDETTDPDGSCRAAAWCPVDASPACILFYDAQSDDAQSDGPADGAVGAEPADAPTEAGAAASSDDATAESEAAASSVDASGSDE